ncbi:aldehyde dehydrogenase family protein [Vreelandella sedimenti]|jgi:betaine-aldehyde dehydrogenase|uniref:aldehyde dehydrogenase family protein n=1 Tax=Vreelandella sedimenti TaxID=2729618 RepID=UPI00257C9A0A|nr:aldehyde dehydrogenase family protein [Halomonas sp. UBA3173]|tara:strand:- start:40830 stop:42254 length:1425 start_codon:yes stop_codon:yes gene_type:complete
MYDRNFLYINGQWSLSIGTGSIDLKCPASKARIGSIPRGNAQDIDSAVSAACQAFPKWSQSLPAERADYLRKIQVGLKERQELIARTITEEMGMPLKLSRRIQASLPIATFGMYADLVQQLAFQEKVGNSLVMREPVGVVGCITPWNYPLHQIAAKVAAALAAGCTVVLKPSELAPLDAFILAEVIHEAELPAGVFNLVSGLGLEAGEALVRHPDVDMVTFTGSTRAGMRIAELAAATVKRVALELGGKSAAIILKDADLEKAVKATISNCFLNSGQNCNAHTRMLVPASLHDEAARLAVKFTDTYQIGDPLAESTKIGPLASAQQRDRVLAYIAKGLEEGAVLLAGGAEPPDGCASGYYVKPTVFGQVAPRSTIAQEEIFGPVLSIIPYEDEADAIRIANDTPYGLAGAVWSDSEEHALNVAKQMRAGQVDVNGGRFNMLAPFGGFKRSGYGRELGEYGLEEFLEYKSIQLTT